jgi:hypothetical protein
MTKEISDAVLMLIVPATVALALGVDIAAFVGWVRSKSERAL